MSLDFNGFDKDISAKQVVGFCRKNYYRRKAQEFWASLRHKPIELLKNILISRFLVLRFPEHMMQFNS